MKSLNASEMQQVSGAGHNADAVDPWAGGKKGTNSGSGKSNDPVADCNNGIIGGMVAGSAGGVVGLGLGLAGGAIAGGCFNGNSSSSANNNSQNNNAGSDIGGQCHK